MVSIAWLLLSGAVAGAAEDPAAMVTRAESLRARRQFPAAIELLEQASALRPASVRISLLLAETLGWERRFSEAERVYRQVLVLHPQSQEASMGLARNLLWQGRYAEARARFREVAGSVSDLEAAEGAATAAYWAGDWKTARREFARILQRDPNRRFPRQSLSEIAAATRNEQSLVTEAVDDDQPLRSVRTEAAETLHSDPLTRWRIGAGGYVFHDRRGGGDWTLPFVRVSNRVTLPWQRLRIDSSAGLLRYGDGATRPVGGVTLRRRIGTNSEMVGSFEHRELVATATAHSFHPAVSAFAAGWHREDDPQRTLAAVDAGRLSYADHNRGWFAQGYVLVPVMRRDWFTVAAGASLAARDTSESRFYVESVSSTRVADGSFAYRYLGSYTPYWTPQRLREARAVASVTAALAHASSISLHADAGVATDIAESFGPLVGRGPFPPALTRRGFDRHFHPARLSTSFTTRFSESLHLDLRIERSATAYYRATTFHASLVRRR